MHSRSRSWYVSFDDFELIVQPYVVHYGCQSRSRYALRLSVKVTICTTAASQGHGMHYGWSRSRSRSRNIYFSNISWRNMNNQSQPSFTQHPSADPTEGSGHSMHYGCQSRSQYALRLPVTVTICTTAASHGHGMHNEMISSDDQQIKKLRLPVTVTVFVLLHQKLAVWIIHTYISVILHVRM